MRLAIRPSIRLASGSSHRFPSKANKWLIHYSDPFDLYASHTSPEVWCSFSILLLPTGAVLLPPKLRVGGGSLPRKSSQTKMYLPVLLLGLHLEPDNHI